MPGKVLLTDEDNAIVIRHIHRLGRLDADIRQAGNDTRKTWALLTALKNFCGDYIEEGWVTWPGHARRLAEGN